MISNISKNCMGTTSFDGKFGRMRKAQSFIVYPINSNTTKLCVQSSNRWAEIDLTTNVLTLSATHSHANSMALMLDNIRGQSETIQLNDDVLLPLLTHIRGTVSPMAGNNALGIYCDNSKANLV